MVTRLLRLGLLAAVTLVLVTAAPAAQQKPLTLDDIYGPTAAGELQRRAGADD